MQHLNLEREHGAHAELIEAAAVLLSFFNKLPSIDASESAQVVYS